MKPSEDKPDSLDNKIWKLRTAINQYSSNPEDYIKPYRDLINEIVEPFRLKLKEKEQEIEYWKKCNDGSCNLGILVCDDLKKKHLDDLKEIEILSRYVDNHDDLIYNFQKIHKFVMSLIQSEGTTKKE